MIYKVANFNRRMARIDICNEGGKGNNLVIEDNRVQNVETRIEMPNWGKTGSGTTGIVEDTSGEIDVHIRCYGAGTLKVRLRGADVRKPDGRRSPRWIQYHSVRLNGIEQLSKPTEAWHDKPTDLAFPVQDKQELELSIRWRPRMEIISGEVPTVKQIDDVWRCIDWFDTRGGDVYLVDADNRFCWSVVQCRESALVLDEQGRVGLNFTSVCPVVLQSSVDSLANADVCSRVLDRASRLALVEEAEEFPVLSLDGKILAVAREYGLDGEVGEGETLNWEIFNHVPHGMPTGKIYIASASSRMMADFVSYWQNVLDIEVLTPDTIVDFLSGKQRGTLVSRHAICGKFCKNVSVRELYAKYERHLRILEAAKRCVISHDWASVKEEAFSHLPGIVALFDQGHPCIHVVDGHGLYKGTITQAQFKSRFPKSECTALQQFALPWETDEQQCKYLWGSLFLKRWMAEAVFLSDGKIVATGMKENGMAEIREKDVQQRQPAYWNLISDRTAVDFFGTRRILLSSCTGVLEGFRKRFSRILQIEVFQDEILNDCLYDSNAILLFSADIWQNSKVPKISIWVLYAEFLAKEMVDYYVANNITYYCWKYWGAKDWKNRVKHMHEPAKATPMVWSGLRLDYATFSDNISDDTCIRVIGGRRQDADCVQDEVRTVHVFGPCIAWGHYVPDGDTIEAKLQEHFLSSGKRWRVLNYGTLGTFMPTFNHLNNLYRMMDAHIREGDIVLHLSAWLWQHVKLPSGAYMFMHNDAFDDPAHRMGKYWEAGDSPAHLNADGNAVLAEFLSQKMLAAPMPVQEAHRRRLVPPFSYRFGNERIMNPDLRSYLVKLSEHRHDVRGAIVMNANPFTLGHQYLVRQARAQCDMLYVFVVEEDRSEISFADRFAIVQANCKGMPNVEVLPSGRYMISSITFTEYFEKEERQDQVVLPSNDIRIFGEAIAPTLHITKRFVGEEPFDNVTRQYNEAMKWMLPEFGVELVEIPRRVAEDGRPINATQVRKWMHEGNWEACRAYLPMETLSYLRNCPSIDTSSGVVSS